MPRDRSKIVFRKGHSDDLPQALAPGELGFTTDDGRLYIGPDPLYGYQQFERSAHPYRNIQLLTEQTHEEFSKMHSERMREGTYYDYHESRLEPDILKWTTIQIMRDGDLIDYSIPFERNVSAFIDYTVVVDDTGDVIRKGRMIVRFYFDQLSISDESSHSRDGSLIGKSSYDPRDVFGRVKFSFEIDNDRLIFKYKNWSFDHLTLGFKVSRPSIDAEIDFIRSPIIISTTILAEASEPEEEEEGIEE